LKLNGALLNRVSFARLWAYAQASGNLVTDAAWLAANGPIGAFSQGDGSTTFRIPDLRGEFIRGFDDGRGADAGRGIGTFQDGQLLSHGHAITDPTHAHGVAGNNGGTAGIVATYNVANDTAYFLQYHHREYWRCGKPATKHRASCLHQILKRGQHHGYLQLSSCDGRFAWRHKS
jgi:microcystin-dependent protein